MAKQNLTDRLLKSLKPKADRYDVMDTAVPGFGVRVSDGRKTFILIGRFPQHDKGLFDRTHVRFFTWDGWTELLRRSGFHVEDVRSSCMPFGLAVPKWEKSLAVRALERLSYEAARGWKKMFAYQFVVRATAGADA